ncbi:MAG: M20/M25/M40 family metallo-hydrolase [Planctomycetes bacterium]|nr:M20/M25/M40 family metallo-hydrolase [Planctomycetota bacterium]
MTDVLPPAAIEFIRRSAGSERYADYLREVLVRLVAVNTAGEGSIAEIAAREGQLFDIIQGELAATDSAAGVERVPIDPMIAADPDYTVPLYAIGRDGSVPMAAQIYAGRCNLVATPASVSAVALDTRRDSVAPGRSASRRESRVAGRVDDRPPVILHAHIDVVPPWFGPRQEGPRVFGRGTCDNKAQAAILLAQMRLLNELQADLGVAAARRRVYQFVIDEEIGGNGSLALARDPRLAGASVLVHETTGLRPYCAHRGCVYYRCRLSTDGAADISALEMFPFVVLAMEDEGRRIRAESNTPMFLPTHVQTNHGTLGPFGHACGAVCDHVAFEISARARANAERIGMKTIEFLDDAVAEYVKLYGDKTRQRDPVTGQPKVARHFDVKVVPGPEFHTLRLDVYGRGGHMGALFECDNAITKAAYLLAALMRVARQFPAVRAFGRLAEDGASGGDPRSVPTELWLQGGQGFTPSHRMEDVKTRLRAAARRGGQEYCRFRRAAFRESMVEMTFDLLHNDAYADSPDSEPMRALRTAFAAVGEPWPEALAWETSCDARIYHHKGCSAAIFGAGALEVAHGPNEYVDIPEMQKALAISTLATWAMIAGE